MEQTRLIKGIWIPIEVWEDTRLTWAEKVLLMEIDSFTKNGIDCFFSDEYAAGFLNVSTRSAANYIAHLVELGLVKKTKFDGRRRYLQSALSIEVLQSRDAKIAEQECKNCRAEMQNLQTNNTSIINKQNICIESESNSATRKFSIPSPSEVQAYCDERNNGITGEEFCDYYESNGWKVNKTPMKDWKAAVRNWERIRASKRKTATSAPKQSTAPKEDYITRAQKQWERICGAASPEALAEMQSILNTTQR